MPFSLNPRNLTRGRNAAILLTLTVLAGGALRFAIQQRSAPFMPDSCQLLLIARSLAAGEGFQSGGTLHPDLSRSPLFVLLIAGASFVTGDVESAAKLVTVLAGALVVVPFFFLARAAFGPVGAIVAIPLATLSCVVGASAILLSTAPYLLFSVAAAAAAWTALRRDSSVLSVAAGLLAGAAALTRAEGLVWAPLLAVAVAVMGRSRPAGRPGAVAAPFRYRRVMRAGFLLAGFLAVYAPYVAWASARLDRFAPAPPIEYLQKMREVADRFGLRHAGEPGITWWDRAVFLATADHRRRVLETYFEEGVIPHPDTTEAAREDDAGWVPGDAAWSSTALRRTGILLANLRAAAGTMRHEHFLPPVLVVLGIVGVGSALRSRRGRRVLLFAAAAGAAGLAPLASHIEARFLYVPFAFGLFMAAAGWAVLARVADPSRRAIWWGLHLVIAAAVLYGGVGHVPPRPGYERRFALLREVAAETREVLPPGPMLAVHPLFPYWAERPYRAVPLGGPGTILDYARAQGATTLVIEGDRDLAQRPDLRVLAGETLPAGFAILESRLNPGKGEFRLLALDTAPPVAPGAASGEGAPPPD